MRDIPGIDKGINPREWDHIDAENGTGWSDKYHQNEDYITYIEFDRVVIPPLGSALVPVPAIFEMRCI